MRLPPPLLSLLGYGECADPVPVPAFSGQGHSEKELAVTGQELDRILLWSFYVIPGGYPIGRRMVYWDRFGYPEPTPDMKNAGFHQLRWFDEEESARVDAGIAVLE